MDVSERLREVYGAWGHYPNPPSVMKNAADIIDALVSALELTRSMRTVDALSPAEHEFEKDKRREAWSKIDLEIDSTLALARGEGKADV